MRDIPYRRGSGIPLLDIFIAIGRDLFVGPSVTTTHLQTTFRLCNTIITS